MIGMLQMIPISFLPLAPAFDKASTKAWATLASRIQDWLIFYIHDEHLPHWKWGAEVFWIAFVAAFPSFPLGDWALWDARIPFVGTFIEKQIGPPRFEEALPQAGEYAVEDLLKRREELWDEFIKVVKIRYPFPVRHCDAPGENV
jgi:hypothetical protein